MKPARPAESRQLPLLLSVPRLFLLRYLPPSCVGTNPQFALTPNRVASDD
jgi:hypothetical protein